MALGSMPRRPSRAFWLVLVVGVVGLWLGLLAPQMRAQNRAFRHLDKSLRFYNGAVVPDRVERGYRTPAQGAADAVPSVAR